MYTVFYYKRPVFKTLEGYKDQNFKKLEIYIFPTLRNWSLTNSRNGIIKSHYLLLKLSFKDQKSNTERYFAPVLNLIMETLNLGTFKIRVALTCPEF